MITANSFMKREFGKGLITKCLPRWNLTGIVNTAGAYIPGHGTPTVILFGTNEPPEGDSVWAVLGKRGEPSTPEDPEQGLVSRSIVDHGQEIGFENDRPEAGRPEDARYAFSGTALGQLPVPKLDDHRAALIRLARTAQDHASRLHADLSGTGAVQRALASGVAVQECIAQVASERSETERLLHATQQLVDELVYEICGLPVKQAIAGEKLTPDMPVEALVSLEGPVHKRNWKGKRGSFGHLSTTFDEDVVAAASGILLDRIESYLATSALIAPLRDLTAALGESQDVRRHRECTSYPDLVELIEAAFAGDVSVPFLAAYGYNEAGLEKRAAWERTWDLQRREDAGEDVGDIPVPPKYDPEDFKDPASYRLRGKLDVPKERFISYPGCEGDDDKSPLFGWAGWTHLQRAQALSALYMQPKQEAWTQDRLTPLLAGLQELIPWLKQWHNAPAPEFNDLKLGDYFESFVEAELKALDLTQEDLRTWRPTTKRRHS